MSNRRTNEIRLRLRTGVVIELVALHQVRHYINSRLEGLPTKEENERGIQSVVSTERKRLNREPYLLEPPQIPLDFPLSEPYPFGTPARIPDILCVGDFQSGNIGFSSYLTVIWFQDHFALPISGDIIRAIKEIEWHKFAIRVPNFEDW